MYSQNKDISLSKPIITNLSLESQRLRIWIKENNSEKFEDIDGLTWNVMVKELSIPDPTGIHQSKLNVTVTFHTKANATKFIQTDTLDSNGDKRLIALLGADEISFQFKSITFIAATVEQARVELGNQILKVKEKLQSGNLQVIKRQLIGKWIEKKMVFGK